MIYTIYCWLLWHMGFKDEDNRFETNSDREKITWMLIRSQQRAKLFWFIVTNLWFSGLAILIFIHKWYLIPIYLFFFWLYVHVLWDFRPPVKPRKKYPKRVKEDEISEEVSVQDLPSVSVSTQGMESLPKEVG